MTYEEKLEAAGYKLPINQHNSIRPFESAVQTGKLIFVSGHAARVSGELIYSGIVGDTVTINQAKEAAKIAFINCMAAVKKTVGTLEVIDKIVNVKGYVASTANFTKQPEVMNEVSTLINDVFGDAGKHSRVAIGASSLPGGTSVEVEMVIQIK